jgi:hypothetical protein
MGDLIIFALIPLIAGWIGGVCAALVVLHLTTPKRRDMPTWAAHDHDWRGK